VGIAMLLGSGVFAPGIAAEPATNPATNPAPATITSLRQLRLAVGAERRKVCSFQVDAVVRVASADGLFWLQDESETALIELDGGGLVFQPGERVLLQGNNCAVGRRDCGLKIGGLPVVDVDGSHPPITEAGATFLRAGRTPIRVVWFNDVLGATLELEYRGPGLRRQRIPEAALVRDVPDPATGQTNFEAGVRYRCFEGQWARLPDFGALVPQRTGGAANFDVGVRTRDEHVGLEFTGWLTVPQAGTYTFYV
jgi:hypothetical protein